MTFKDLKIGDTIYIIDKVNAEAKVGKVASITLATGLQPGQIGVFKNVSVMVGNDNKLYTVNEVWDTALADNGRVVVTPNMDRALLEVKNVKAQCEDIVKNIDHYKENITKCDKLLAELDPSFKEKQAVEQRFTRLEEAISQQAKSTTEIKDMLSKLLPK